MSTLAITGPRRRRGFSLIELACVLAIIAILLAGVMLLYGSTSAARRTNDTIVEITSIVSSMHSLYSGQSAYNGLSTSTVINSGLLPQKWVSGTALTDPFGGAVTVATYNPATVINIWVYGLPYTACMAIATSDFGSYSSSARNINWKSDSSGNAFTPAAAAAACSGNNNFIGFNFY